MDNSQNSGELRKPIVPRWIKLSLIYFVINTFFLFTAPADISKDKYIKIFLIIILSTLPVGYLMDKLALRASDKDDEKFKNLTSKLWKIFMYIMFVFLYLIIGILLFNYFIA